MECVSPHSSAGARTRALEPAGIRITAALTPLSRALWSVLHSLRVFPAPALRPAVLKLDTQWARGLEESRPDGGDLQREACKKPENTGKLVTGWEVLWRKEIRSLDPDDCRGWGECELLHWMRWLGTAFSEDRTEARDPQC